LDFWIQSIKRFYFAFLYRIKTFLLAS
jgi:hypothetical protein